MIEEKAGDDGEYSSKGEVMRSIIDDHQDSQDLQTQVDRLQREKQMILDQRSDHQQLIRHVEDEREERQRRQKKEEAPIWRRTKWWIMGVPSDRGDD